MVSLIQKYNVPGPRYTSYPTVPYWNESLFNLDTWKKSIQETFKVSNDAEGISLYGLQGNGPVFFHPSILTHAKLDLKC